ncbi:amidohydrolase family protein [Chloroflexota bacterium]
METNHQSWLRLTIEDPIDPGIPICDPHHHLWNRPDRRYPDQRYFLEEFLQDAAGGHRIVQTVFVECGSMYRRDGPKEMRPVGETEFVQGIAAQSASGQYGMTCVAAGIVGFADLTLGAAVVPVLEAHLAASRDRFRGIRYGTAWDTSPNIVPIRNNPPKGLLLDAKFREGFACLQNYHLSYDSWLYHPQLMELVDLARAFPETPIVVNHIGYPLGIGSYVGKREVVFQDWKHGITALADCPNVVVKLGGLGMPNCGFGWHDRTTPPSSVELAEAVAPYYLYCIEQFGVGRCMFESNFPVDKMSYSYTVLWNTFKRISKDFSPEERAALFHNTAIKVYRLATNHEV